jgi:hypothetical protein
MTEPASDASEFRAPSTIVCTLKVTLLFEKNIQNLNTPLKLDMMIFWPFRDFFQIYQTFSV